MPKFWCLVLTGVASATSSCFAEKQPDHNLIVQGSNFNRGAFTPNSSYNTDRITKQTGFYYGVHLVRATTAKTNGQGITRFPPARDTLGCPLAMYGVVNGAGKKSYTFFMLLQPEKKLEGKKITVGALGRQTVRGDFRLTDKPGPSLGRLSLSIQAQMQEHPTARIIKLSVGFRAAVDTGKYTPGSTYLDIDREKKEIRGDPPVILVRWTRYGPVTTLTKEQLPHSSTRTTRDSRRKCVCCLLALTR